MTAIICGIDEAGRGPLAGHVYAGAVILGDNFKIKFNSVFEMLNDSKKLSLEKRKQLEKEIKENALAWGIGLSTYEEIDKINILQASLLAMKRAYITMIEEAANKNIVLPDSGISVIVDGNKTPDLPVPCTALVKADMQVPEVMAASILAKTARDTYMEEMAKLYPQYLYEKHKGYPTKAHRELIKKYGPSPIQRISFSVS
ncbi:MAG: ribonuclease HII [Treponema sp.]|jgi:ribonuclease HII|nr:ribonuclease HII [Treponema sp.]